LSKKHGDKTLPRLDLKALVLAMTLLWGGAYLLTAGANLVWPTYARDFIELLASIYPGYAADGSLGDLLVGFGYALVDAALGTFFFGCIYNHFAE
jgi:hypothetical protein